LDANQRSVMLIRGGREGAAADIRKLDLKSIYAQGNLSQNQMVVKGDIVYVPRTFIADVDRFFMHFENIIKPLLNVETGYWVGQHIETGVSRSSASSIGIR